MSLDPDFHAESDLSDTTNDTDAGLASATDTGASESTPCAFAALGLPPQVVSTIRRGGYDQPTDVQARAVPAALAGGDLLVSSRTGSGKTAAFVWPALARVQAARQDRDQRRQRGRPSGPRVLVLAPTRELAMQVSRAATQYGAGLQGLRVAHVVGGVPYSAQLRALRGPIDLLVATPGRLIDLLRSGAAIVSNVETLVLDEADRMLDMGFIDDITHIAEQLPPNRQTLMFSATFAGAVGRLAEDLTNEPQRITVDSHTDAHGQIEQRLHWADSPQHKHALLEQLLADRDIDQAVVFASTQIETERLADQLADIGHAVAALHGGMPQGRRNRVLQGLRQRQLRVLVATDVAARGIDVPTITHVINHGLPMKAEDYVHRIGRTGRAGRQGLAITLAERRDVGIVRRVEQFTRQPIAVAVVPGLEPQRPAPEDRPFGARGPRPGGPGRGRGPRDRDYGANNGWHNPDFAPASDADRPRRGKPAHARADTPFSPRGDDRSGKPPFKGGFKSDFRGDFRSEPRGDFRGEGRGDFRSDFRNDSRGDDRGDFRPGFKGPRHADRQGGEHGGAPRGEGRGSAYRGQADHGPQGGHQGGYQGRHEGRGDHRFESRGEGRPGPRFGAPREDGGRFESRGPRAGHGPAGRSDRAPTHRKGPRQGPAR